MFHLQQRNDKRSCCVYIHHIQPTTDDQRKIDNRFHYTAENQRE